MNAGEFLKNKYTELAAKGVPILVLQDPLTKLPSITFTFFVLSGLICLLATLDFVKIFAGINFEEIKQFFDMCSYVYVGRSAVKAMLGTNETK
jgi:energy-converting hydrogenase Eha subunit C